MKRIKIIADSKIPYLQGVLEPFAEVAYLLPEQIDAEAVRDADALLIRTRTCCDERLLEGSQVKMIATATIGYDHIDAAYCQAKGISWRSAPGCNASSVGQYIAASLLLLYEQKGEPIEGKTIGIVGLGNVGKTVERICSILGMSVLRCDPPRAAEEIDADFVSLDTIARNADVITFHTPLSHQGEYKTYHLGDKAFFESLSNRPVLINTSRGEVIDQVALEWAYHEGLISDMVIDCWEGEPHIHVQLMNLCFLATPHIAGYSADGKASATRMAVMNIARYFGFDQEIDITGIVPPDPANPDIDVSLLDGDPLTQAVLRSYDPSEDSAKLKESPSSFEMQRGAYPLRREFMAYNLFNTEGAANYLLQQLGFGLA